MTARPWLTTRSSLRPMAEAVEGAGGRYRHSIQPGDGSGKDDGRQDRLGENLPLRLGGPKDKGGGGETAPPKGRPFKFLTVNAVVIVRAARGFRPYCCPNHVLLSIV